MTGILGTTILILGGIGLLYLGAEWLVRGGAGLARRLGISPLIVGLTVVAYGTSAPEVVVGLQAGWTGHGELAIGNVIGSNIANLGLILGFAALLRPAPVPRTLARGDAPVMLVATLAVMLMLANGHIAAWEAVLLLAMAVAYTTWMVLRARSGRIPEPHFEEAECAAETTGAPSRATYPRLAFLIVVGLILLVAGGRCLVQGASTLAKALGMSERLIGLTIVAVGTSVPELATSLVAAWRGHTDIAVGNVVGSNIFNVFLCLGSAGLPGALRSLPTLANPDLLALALITLVGLFLLRTERTIQRWEGALLLGSYGGYLAYLILQA